MEKKTLTSLKDPKSLLQEKVQALGLSAPKYQVIEEVGPAHDRQFTIEVMIDNKKISKGTGKSKSEGEQDAAIKALSSYCGITYNNL